MHKQHSLHCSMEFAKAVFVAPGKTIWLSNFGDTCEELIGILQCTSLRRKVHCKREPLAFCWPAASNISSSLCPCAAFPSNAAGFEACGWRLQHIAFCALPVVQGQTKKFDRLLNECTFTVHVGKAVAVYRRSTYGPHTFIPHSQPHSLVGGNRDSCKPFVRGLNRTWSGTSTHLPKKG